MSGERVVAVVVLSSLAVALLVVGWLGGRGSIRFALGGRAGDGPPQPAAQRAIGRWFGVGGVCAAIAAVAAVIVPESALGPVLTVGSVAVAVSAIVAVAAGVRHIE